MSEPWGAGLCPRCLYGLVVDAPSLVAELEEAVAAKEQPVVDQALDDSAPTLGLPGETLAPGAVLGKRYRIRSLLGRGGMGEVWRAFDLKLRVDVALKALRPELVRQVRALEALRDEVRSAREVMSPNVCRVFDLVELDGQELVSMEFIDGITLLDILKMRAPLELTEAREIASQFLAGLEAIHRADLVHRDLKPENIMMTRSGRVVVMDLGIAKSLVRESTQTVSGTPAYMAPEQAAGETLSPAADVFSAGVMLAEMIAPGGLCTLEARQKVWRAVRSEPLALPKTPWSAVLKRALASATSERYSTAAGLARALEEVTLRVAGADEIHPYPGLASFTQEESEYFFGRELEVEDMWKKLRRAHLIGLIGPSGAGKSSFLRAGLLKVTPSDWRALVIAPGTSPFRSLARALAPELSGDAEAIDQLLDFDDPQVAVSLIGRWRSQSGEALLIVDQFEELFTQSPSEVQAAFAEMLARLAVDADVHVLLSMRDDFLFHCSSQPTLSPMFSELTPLRPPTGAALRRALVQPALKGGYRFEDDALVDEMIAELSQERGALPMLAFAAARLWDLRDRDRGLLTREAYDHIGGVGGALAQHAEQTLERIGQDEIPTVREIFRNLVTSQGTRIARTRDELLSVFAVTAGSNEAGVLDSLIDARLLTSYEVAGDGDEERQQRIEIVHESLLSNWPRLVRWQAQDEDGALLRDQLRQAAQMWEERGHPEDLLWTGTSFKEYELWRERYVGGLSAGEEAFAVAMRSRAERQKRRKHQVVGVIVAALLVVLAVVASLWHRAEGEARRAEAQKLLALGQLERDSYPTAALAYASKSLELADTREGRMAVLDALWRGPPALIAYDGASRRHEQSLNGRSLVHDTSRADGRTNGFRLAHRNGSDRTLVQREGMMTVTAKFFDDEEGHVLTIDVDPEQGGVRSTIWSPTQDEPLGSHLFQDPWTFGRSYRTGEFLVLGVDGGKVVLYAMSSDGSRRLVDTVDLPVDLGGRLRADIASATGDWLGALVDGEVLVAAIDERSVSQPRGLGRHSEATLIHVDALGRFVVTAERGGEFRLWRLESDAEAQSFDGPENPAEIDSTLDGRLLFARSAEDEEDRQEIWVWEVESGSPALLRRLETAAASRPSVDPKRLRVSVVSEEVQSYSLRHPAGARPLKLRSQDSQFGWVSTAPRGESLVTSGISGVLLWPLTHDYPAAVPRPSTADLAFESHGRWLASAGLDGTLVIWPLEGEVPERPKTILEDEEVSFTNVAISPIGKHLLAATGRRSRAGGPLLVSINNREPVLLPKAFEDQIYGLAISPDGRLGAAVGGQFVAEENLIRVWDLEQRELVAELESPDVTSMVSLEFSSENQLLAAGELGLRRWSVDTGQSEILYSGPVWIFGCSRSCSKVVALESGDPESLFEYGRALVLDVDTGNVVELETHGSEVATVAIDREGKRIATADSDGLIRVGSSSGGEPHLLIGSPAGVFSLAFDPQGRWLVSASTDEIRFWSVPDIDAVPLHAWPHDELIAKLHSLTNLRLIEDSSADSATGWKLEVAPFPGWKELPTW